MFENYHKRGVDKIFLISVLSLIIIGFGIFISASMGLLARDGASMSSVVINQVGGIVGGLVLMYLFSKINYRFWRKYAFYIFVISLVLTCLVFAPKIGFEHGGAKRWIVLFGLTLQTSEFLKIGFIIYFSAWLANAKEKVATVKHGLIPFVIILSLVGLILLKQPDTDTFMIIAFSGLAMFYSAGAKFKHLIYVGLAGIAIFAVLVFFRPYLMQRVEVFLNPSSNATGSGYQIQQSLIAIGSGGLFGRGFGQSIQKFKYLPEPIGDSIFAVASEEFGIMGGIILLILYTFLTWRGMRISNHAPDHFARLFTVGIVILIVSQALVNIGAMVGIMPLSGITLPFVSHGGTAMLALLAEIGILLNISRYVRK